MKTLNQIRVELQNLIEFHIADAKPESQEDVDQVFFAVILAEICELKLELQKMKEGN